MEEHINPVDSSFAGIKRSLDPLHGYMIFEEPLDYPNSVLLKQVPDLLSQFDKGILEQTLYRDETGEKLYLVVRLDPGEVDDLSQKFLDVRLPKETTFYIYRKRSNPTS